MYDAHFFVNQYIYENLDLNNKTMSIFLGIGKAFDTINHEILLKKLYYAGIRGTENDLVKSYLTNRMQVVKLNENYSTPLILNHGEPQGSVLGSIFFIIYINGVLNINVDANTVCFADDTIILANEKKYINYIPKVMKSLI